MVPHLGYTRERIAEQFLLEKNATFVDATEMWYPKFATSVMEHAGVVK